MKRTVIITLLLSIYFGFSQELAGSFPIQLEKKVDVFQIVNDSTKITTFFFDTKNAIKSIRLNDKLQVQDSLITLKVNNNQESMVGNLVHNSKTNLFWLAFDRKKITAQTFDFENAKTSSATYDLDFKNEDYIQSFSTKNKFIVLSIVKDSNTLKLYAFDGLGKMETKIINLDQLKYYHRLNLYETFEESIDGFEAPFSLTIVNNGSPTSIIKASKKRKAYVTDDKITITIDTDYSFTQTIVLDLKTYQATGKIIKNTDIKFFNSLELNSNSFLIDDFLCQIKTSSSKATFLIKNSDDQLIKEYILLDDKPIEFKNSEIIQEDGSKENKRILKSTNQFLRKINNYSVGLSLYKTKNQYFTTIGSVSELKKKVTLTDVLVIAAVGTIGFMMVDALKNPTLADFNSFADRKVVYMNSLFDLTGNHINGTTEPLAFDKINSFLDPKKDYKSKTIFKKDASFYLGYFDDAQKKYLLYKFTD